MRVRVSMFSLIGFTVFWTILSATVDARAAQRNAAVVIDGWWSGDYARKACEQAKSFTTDEYESRVRTFGCGAVPDCPEMMARTAACTSGIDPKARAAQFEDRLMTAFAADPGCKGASFARYAGPDAPAPSAAAQAVMSAPHWELSVDFAAGASTQSWSLQYLGEERVLQGHSATEAAMASDVCAILLGRGGTSGR